MSNKRLKSIVGMGFASGIQVIVNIIRVKIVAVLLGTIGVGITSLINNLIGTLVPITSLGLNQGIVKGISEDLDNKQKIKSIQATAYLSTLILSLIGVSIVLLFPQIIRFDDNVGFNNQVLIALVIFSVPFMTLNQINIAIINGFREVRILGIANVVSSIITLIVSVILTYKYGLTGALVSIFVTAVVVFFVYWTMGKTKAVGAEYRFKISDFNMQILRQLIKYGAASLLIGFLSNISILWVRKIIINNIGMNNVGIFQADWALINQYLGLVLAALSTYLMPALCSLKNNKDICLELNETLKLLLLLIFPLMIVIVLFGGIIIILFYSKQFIYAATLLPIFIIGDFLKIISWTIGMTLWTIPKLKKIVFLNILECIILPLATLLLINKLGLVSIAIAYILQNILDLAYNYFVLRNEIEFSFSRDNLKLILVSFVVLIFDVTLITFISNRFYVFLFMIVSVILWINFAVQKKDAIKVKEYIMSFLAKKTSKGTK